MPAMRCAFTFALCSLLLAGCTTTGGHKPTSSDKNTSATSSAILPSPMQIVGRVIAVDLRTLNVIIAVSPFTVLPGDFARRILITRTDDLRATAKLQCSPYLRGRTLGARILVGRANVGDEVVMPPAAP